jgi:hypothetical protein
MNQITHVRKSPGTLGLLLVLASAVGCAPSLIAGPLTYQQEERDHTLNQARQAGMSTDLLDRVLSPLTPEEKSLADELDHSPSFSGRARSSIDRRPRSRDGSKAGT